MSWKDFSTWSTFANAPSFQSDWRISKDWLEEEIQISDRSHFRQVINIDSYSKALDNLDSKFRTRGGSAKPFATMVDLLSRNAQNEMQEFMRKTNNYEIRKTERYSSTDLTMLDTVRHLPHRDANEESGRRTFPHSFLSRCIVFCQEIDENEYQ